MRVSWLGLVFKSSSSSAHNDGPRYLKAYWVVWRLHKGDFKWNISCRPGYHTMCIWGYHYLIAKPSRCQIVHMCRFVVWHDNAPCLTGRLGLSHDSCPLYVFFYLHGKRSLVHSLVFFGGHNCLWHQDRYLNSFMISISSSKSFIVRSLVSISCYDFQGTWLLTYSCWLWYVVGHARVCFMQFHVQLDF